MWRKYQLPYNTPATLSLHLQMIPPLALIIVPITCLFLYPHLQNIFINLEMYFFQQTLAIFQQMSNSEYGHHVYRCAGTWPFLQNLLYIPTRATQVSCLLQPHVCILSFFLRVWHCLLLLKTAASLQHTELAFLESSLKEKYCNQTTLQSNTLNMSGGWR